MLGICHHFPTVMGVKTPLPLKMKLTATGNKLHNNPPRLKSQGRGRF